MSNNPLMKNIDFDGTNILELKSSSNDKNNINTEVVTKKTDASFILKGKRDGSLKTLSSAY